MPKIVFLLAIMTAAGCVFEVKADALRNPLAPSRHGGFLGAAAGEIQVEARIPMVNVSGIVIDRQGLPRASAQIWDGTGYPPRDSARTDSSGRFILDNFRPGQHKWLVHSYAAGSMGLFTIPDDYTGKPIQVVLDYDEGHAQGVVLDKAGRPVANREVVILLKTPKGEQFRLGPVKTQNDGRYSILLPSKTGVKVQAQLLTKDANAPKLQTPEITLSQTDIFMEFPPIAPPGADIEKELQNRIVISGVIVDEAGLPIPAVRVNVMYRDNYNMSMETITDKDGRWRLPLPAQASNVSLRLLHPDFISYHFDPRGQREPSLAELKSGDCKLIMQRGLTVTGRISEKQNNPVENALVTAGRMYSFGGNQIIEDCTTARSSKDGTFSISGMPPEEVKLMVFAEGFSPKLVDVDMTKQSGTLDVSLSPGRTYRGQIVDDSNKPLAGVLLSNCQWVSGVDMKMLSLTATTDSTGSFAIPDVPDEGEVRFILGKHVGDWQLFMKKMPQDLSEIDRIVMAKAPLFAGKIVDAETNEPVKNIELTAGRTYTPVDDKIHWYYHYDSRKVVSRGGFFKVQWEGFVVDYPCQNSAYLKIQSPDYLPAVLGPLKPGEEQKSVEVRLVRQEPLKGAVVDSNDNPVAEAQLAFIREGERAYIKNGRFDSQDFLDKPEITATTDAQGRFVLGPVDEVGIILVLASTGWAQLDSNDFDSGSSIHLSPWSRIEAEIHPSLVSSLTPEISVRPTHYDYMETVPSVIWNFEPASVSSQRVVFDFLPASPDERASRGGPAEKIKIGRIIRGEMSDAEIIDCQPGKTYNITVGRENRTVKGKILLPDADGHYDFDFTDLRRVRAACWLLEPDDVASVSDEKINSFFWLYLDAGKPYEKSMTAQKKFIPQIDRYGNFTFDSLPPGRYEFVVNIHDPLPLDACGKGLLHAAVFTEITVPDENDLAPVVIPDLKPYLVNTGPQNTIP